ncbi:prostatic spermine-binding protein-like [Octopus sinensis]|uniref:Prostatic spermine-binding protein-like n=1 Tax=Octopus sinensis TaxID=2607531 RepID=A0A6P7T6D9_9MOLL|nr:prostatic spermine-binding protein-like [Octopus sinensis]
MKNRLKDASLQKKLNGAFLHIEKALEIFKQQDADFERCSTVAANLMRGHRCYSEIYREIKKECFQQTNLDNILTEKTNADQTSKQEESQQIELTCHLYRIDTNVETDNPEDQEFLRECEKEKADAVTDYDEDDVDKDGGEDEEGGSGEDDDDGGGNNGDRVDRDHDD